MKSSYNKVLSLLVLSSLLVSCGSRSQLAKTTDTIIEHFPQKSATASTIKNTSKIPLAKPKQVMKVIKAGTKVYQVYADCKNGKLLSAEEYNKQNVLVKAALSNAQVKELVEKACTKP